MPWKTSKDERGSTSKKREGKREKKKKAVAPKPEDEDEVVAEAEAEDEEEMPSRGLTRLTAHFQVPMWRVVMQATVLHVPHGVMQSRILPYLSWEDGRSLSRMCLALREDALTHMTKLAEAKVGSWVKSEDPKELNLVMACLAVPEEDQFVAKPGLMSRFCLAPKFASRLQYSVIPFTYALFDVVEATLKRFGTLSKMRVHKSNRKRARKEGGGAGRAPRPREDAGRGVCSSGKYTVGQAY